MLPPPVPRAKYKHVAFWVFSSISVALLVLPFVCRESATRPSPNAGDPARHEPASREAGGGAAAASHAASSMVDPAARARGAEAYGRLPLNFEANRGQTDARVKFIARGQGYALFLTPGEAVLRLRGKTESRAEGKGDSDAVSPAMADAAAATDSVLRIGLVGANASPRVSGRDELANRSNYFVGPHARARGARTSRTMGGSSTRRSAPASTSSTTATSVNSNTTSSSRRTRTRDASSSRMRVRSRSAWAGAAI